MLIVRPGFIDVSEFRVLGNASSDGELVSGVIEEAVGGDGRGGEIDVLHFGWGGVRCVASFYIQRGFLWHVLSSLLVPKNFPRSDILPISQGKGILGLSSYVR